MSALVWWLIPLIACIGALIYVWWSINSKRRQNTYKSIAEYENFRSAFDKQAERALALGSDEPGAQEVRTVKSRSGKAGRARTARTARTTGIDREQEERKK